MQRIDKVKIPCPSTQRTTSTTSETNTAAEHLFFQLSFYYQNLWAREYGKTPTEPFLQIFSKITHRHVDRALEKARQSLAKGDKYPPVVGMLISWCETPSEAEYGAILQRVLKRKPQTKIEQWICDTYGYNLRRTQEDKLISKIKHYYQCGLDLKKRNELAPLRKPNERQLPRRAEMSLTDKAISDSAHSIPHRFKKRIEALKKQRR